MTACRYYWPWPGIHPARNASIVITSYSIHYTKLYDPIYDDFTVPTFDDRHNLMKGGSWISCGNEAVTGSRYAFRRHFFQHAGFRYVLAETPVGVPASRYGTDQQVSQYAEVHYGGEYFGVPKFPRVA